MRNRAEHTATDGRGIRCDWEFSSDLHIADVFPSTAARLMRLAFEQWPVALAEEPSDRPEVPQVSFILGHRGLDRLPHLLLTLRSIAGQAGAPIEAVVVEQSFQREVEDLLPRWVRYVHTPTPSPDYEYNRAWTFNAGARAARGTILVFHDNDMLVPAQYAAELMARARERWEFLDLKRFVFYLDERATRRVFDGNALPVGAPPRIAQNLRGGSVAVVRDAYFAVGGFDEEFIGWGGEDNEFWERASVRGEVNQFGYLPFLHLWHAPQKGKLLGGNAPGVSRYYELRNVPPEERIRRLLARR